ncbi:MAG: glycine--tRNA ligase subunit beta, partial [Anaerolineae bacterium]
RYAENPNRMQMHTQLQVILKPDPGDPQERYLRSLEVIGISREEHDIRFVEDNWESPAIGAWGLGWEVWLDGQEITQFTYFQQAGGINLDIPSVELTYGLERIVMYLQNVRSVWDIAWDENHTYGEILADQEIDHCRYEFEYADIDHVREMYDLFEQEALLNLKHGLVVPSLDYILRCSHTFNLLDSRGTVGVTERAVFFKRMRDLSRQVAEAYLAQRDRAGFPWEGRPGLTLAATSPGALMHLPLEEKELSPVETVPVQGRAPFLFELGVEELPATHLSGALAQWRELIPAALDAAKLEHGDVHIWGTPRRLVVYVPEIALGQADETLEVKGPPARAAFDADGNPTRAAQGFARSKGVDVADLQVRETDGGEYVFVTQHVPGRPAAEVLAELLPDWIAQLHFPRAMRWNETGVTFSRPIRWLLALLGEYELPCTYAGLQSGRVTRGPRPAGSPEVALGAATDYKPTLASYGIIVDQDARAAEILQQAQAVAAEVAGQIPDDPALLEEVTNLVEVPTALLGSFEKRYLTLPQDVLIAVMKKHQRYFPVLDARGHIMAHFVTIRNGGSDHLDLVRQGNEDVIRARYADAEFFYNQDCRHPLADYRDGLETLTFQADLGSMLQKSERVEKLAGWVGEQMALSAEDLATLNRAAYLAKADLATRMVVEMTSLQGIMGREYAKRSGESSAVAQAIFEHYLPRSAGDKLPESAPGIALALADRLDSLAGLFAVGLAPTGSADPYGLRRAAAGIVQILLERELPFSTRAGIAKAALTLPVEAAQSTINAAVDFIVGRLQVMLREMGLAYDVVEAALAARGENPTLAREAAQQLTAWVARDDWAFLLDNYARCVRITRDQPRFKLDATVLQEPAEKMLYAALCTAEAAIGPESDVNSFLTAFVPLVSFIQTFFNEVLVMDKDNALREARLALLQRIAGLADGIVDLSKLEGF